MSMVYLVLAESGECENQREWTIAAHTTLDGASKCIERFYNWMALQGAGKDNIAGWCAVGRSRAERIKLETDFEVQFGVYILIDANGVRWKVEEIQLLEDA